MRISVVVPVAAGETHALKLDDQLAGLPDQVQIIYACSAERPAGIQDRALWINVPAGRAAALNAGADHASGDYLWFVHADTILRDDSYAILLSALRRSPQALHYFALRFDDGPWMMRINEIGVSLRCMLFTAPFGDQAFCVPKDLHQRIGGFDPAVAYGEDHLYVRSARKLGVACRALPGNVGTSARKYADDGWMNVVFGNQVKWIRQAWADRSSSQ